MNISLRILFVFLGLFFLFNAAQPAIAMAEDVLEKEISSKSLIQLQDLASAIYDGIFRFETIATAWQMPTACAHQRDVEQAMGKIKLKIKRTVGSGRFAALAGEDRRNVCTIYCTLSYIVKERSHIALCKDIERYRTRIPALTLSAQLIDLLQDFELFKSFHKKKCVENDNAFINACKTLEPKIRSLMGNYRSEYEMVKKYYEALYRELKKQVSQKPRALRNFTFNKYFSKVLLDPFLPQEQMIPGYDAGTTESSKPLPSKKAPEALSSRELNAQVNALMKQFESTAPEPSQKLQKKEGVKTLPSVDEEEQISRVEAYCEDEQTPAIATMSKISFNSLHDYDKVLHLFEYQDYWLKKLSDEQENPIALTLFIKTIYKDYEKHKQTIDMLLDPKHACNSASSQGDLVLIQQLLSHAIQFHKGKMTTQQNQAKVRQITAGYAAYMKVVDDEIQVLLNALNASSHTGPKIQLPDRVIPACKKVCNKLHRKLASQKTNPLDLETCLPKQDAT